MMCSLYQRMYSIFLIFAEFTISAVDIFQFCHATIQYFLVLSNRPPPPPPPTFLKMQVDVLKSKKYNYVN